MREMIPFIMAGFSNDLDKSAKEENTRSEH